jgi:hypothetical protein
MKLPNFESLFDAAAAEFQAAFMKSKNSVRPDEIGSAREGHLRKFLQDWLPRKYGVTHGYVVSLEKKSSRQSDVIVYDESACPKFVQDESNGRRIVPLANTYGIIEVKSTLGENELSDSLQKFDDFSKLLDGFQLQPEYFEEEEGDLSGELYSFDLKSRK